MNKNIINIPSEIRLIPYKYFVNKFNTTQINLFNYIESFKTTLLNDMIQ